VKGLGYPISIPRQNQVDLLGSEVSHKYAAFTTFNLRMGAWALKNPAFSSRNVNLHIKRVGHTWRYLKRQAILAADFGAG
jgi:hypothetical protein